MNLQQISPLFLALVSFTVSFIVIYLLRPVAPKINLVDRPSVRKQHQGHIPLIGGIAICLGFAAGMLLLPISAAPYRALAAGVGILTLIGILDDMHELSSTKRLLAQCITLLLMMGWGGIKLSYLGDLFATGPIILDLLIVPLTLFGAISLINAINLLDGLDGLAGSQVLISLLALAYCAGAAGHIQQMTLLLIVSGGLMAFLLFNLPLPGYPSARIFMGDAGSLLLGFVLAWFTIALSSEPNAAARPVTMLWLVALPLLDLAAVFMHRFRRGVSPFTAGRDHFHHRLQMQGLSPKKILLIAVFFALITSGIGLLAERYAIPEYIMLLSFIILFFGYQHIIYTGSFITKGEHDEQSERYKERNQEEGN